MYFFTALCVKLPWQGFLYGFLAKSAEERSSRRKILRFFLFLFGGREENVVQDQPVAGAVGMQA